MSISVAANVITAQTCCDKLATAREQCNASQPVREERGRHISAELGLGGQSGSGVWSAGSDLDGFQRAAEEHVVRGDQRTHGVVMSPNGVHFL